MAFEVRKFSDNGESTQDIDSGFPWQKYDVLAAGTKEYCRVFRLGINDSKCRTVALKD